MAEQANESCSACGGHGYIYRIGEHRSPRTVQQLLGKSAFQ